MNQNSNSTIRCMRCRVILSEDIDDLENRICEDCKKDDRMNQLMGNKIPRQHHKATSKPRKNRNHE